MKIYIVNFNTTELTTKCINSINTYTPNCQIIIFDNSTILKFNTNIENVKIIDNTNGKLIDFNIVLSENVDNDFYKKTFFMDKSKHGSLKHTYTIEYIILHELENFVLFDSDTVLKKPIDFIDDEYITIAGICHLEPQWKNRFLPFLQYFNVLKIKENNLHYFDKNRIMFGNNPKNNFIYDTGASFYEDILSKKLKYKEILFTDYIDHLACGSWMTDDKQRIIYKNNYNR